jgi:magnesium chelatase subunit D
VLLHAADPVAFGHRFGSGLEALRQRVAAAARRLPAVRLEPEQVRYLVEEAIRAGVEGQRPDLFAVRVARAHAALAGRPAVAAEDLHRAVQLVIVPRAALALPEPPPPPPEAPTEPPAREEPAEPEPPEGQEAEKEPPPEGGPLPPDFVFSPEGVVLDPALLAYAARLRRRHGKAGGGALVRSLERGRYVKPVLPLGAIRRLAIDATLRAAAPHQKARRRSAGRGPGRRGRRILLRDEDLRAKLLARKAGSLVIFVVDASGSMALNRMQAAKGAVLALLGEAYRSRDQIALIVFRGERAQVLLPPTRSITAASRRLERLPCGGGSPLAHGLVLAVRVGENARRAKDVGEVVIVLITDGKANVPLARSLGESTPQGAPAAGSAAATAAVREELLRIAAAIAALNLRLLVVDTGNPHLSSGLTAELASRAGGTPHRLPRADPHALAALTRGSLEGIPAPPGLRLPHPHDPERGPRSR